MRTLYHLPVILLTLIVLASGSLAASQEGMGFEITVAVPQVLQSTPEDAVQNLLWAFIEWDLDAVEQLIAPPDASSQLFLDGFKSAVESGATMEFTDIEVILAENTGEMAHVRARFHQVFRINDDIVSDERSGALHLLVKHGDNWYFIGFGQNPPPGWRIE
jgi:hypothetical protein